MYSPNSKSIPLNRIFWIPVTALELRGFLLALLDAPKLNCIIVCSQQTNAANGARDSLFPKRISRGDKGGVAAVCCTCPRLDVFPRACAAAPRWSTLNAPCPVTAPACSAVRCSAPLSTTLKTEFFLHKYFLFLRSSSLLHLRYL